MRWVGIDEAGYGPNLGPLVMTAVIAEADGPPDDIAQGVPAGVPDLWADLASSVGRAGGTDDRLWMDDSKVILRGGQGRDRLEQTCLAIVDSIGHPLPGTVGELLKALAAGSVEDCELLRWVGTSGPIPWPAAELIRGLEPILRRRPLEPSSGGWRIVGARSVVMGPERFNRGLAEMGSKAKVHFRAFRELLEFVWGRSVDGLPCEVQGDKHGGRHYYLEPLYEAFPHIWIERGPEGPELSRYVLRGEGRTVGLSFSPRADSASGLVALASIVSKTVREVWMGQFNAFWAGHVAGLKPTAGYPNDALRFRKEIATVAAELKLDPALWWRLK